MDDLKDNNEDPENFNFQDILTQQEQLENFWNSPLDFYDKELVHGIYKDIAPFIVLENTAMNKLHFLFLMLNISQVNIVDQGQITGIITKLEFLKKRKEEDTMIEEEKKRQSDPALRATSLGKKKLNIMPFINKTATKSGIHSHAVADVDQDVQQKLLEGAGPDH